MYRGSIMRVARYVQETGLVEHNNWKVKHGFSFWKILAQW